MMRQRQLILAMTGAIPVLLVLGCAGQPKAPSGAPSAVRTVRQLAPPTGEAAPAVEAAYVIMPGDELEVSFSYHPEFNRRMEVRPDGKISLPLVHDIVAAGKTPDQLSGELATSYAEELKNPDIVVIIHRVSGRVAYVGGEVNAPQMILLDRPTTLLQAIIRSGNTRRTAEETNVLVLRATPGSAPTVLAVNLKRVRAGRASGLVLEPYDVVFVPKTIIAEVGQFVDDYINNIVPRALGFQFVYDLQPEVRLDDDTGRILFSRTNVR